jgi:hypothetical protein
MFVTRLNLEYDFCKEARGEQPWLKLGTALLVSMFEDFI